MIQSILFFSLGFLTSAFLALMVAPAIWSRAVALTRRRIEATVPLSVNEISADKDRMRAEFAMSTRRLEMSIKSFKEKASAQVIEITRNREEMKRLADERAEKDRAAAALEAKAGEASAELRQRDEQLQRLKARLAESEKMLEARALEIERIGRLFDEATLTASNRQIELVAREAEYERLVMDKDALRDARKEGDRRVREVAAELKTVQEALKNERKRAGDFEQKTERLMATLSDREEKLDRREKELSRLREQSRGGSRAASTMDSQLAEVQADRVRLEAEVSGLQLQLSTLLDGGKGGGVEDAMRKLNAERDRMEERLTILSRENKKLKGELVAAEQAKSEGPLADSRDSTLLREQINNLAAEVVHLTAMLDGPDSPIRKIIGASGPTGNNGRIVSLADRVRALQTAASAQAVEQLRAAARS